MTGSFIRRAIGRPLKSIGGLFVTIGVLAAICSGQATQTDRDPRLAWWHDAQFGMFIHWGLYAIPAGMWPLQNGVIYPNTSEWILAQANIPIDKYELLADQFHPVNFDAAAWVSLARKAGMKYLIITAKHHDGFGMWDSKYSDFDIGRVTDFKHDILKELSEECARQGIKFGLYYSIIDWHHPALETNPHPAGCGGLPDGYPCPPSQGIIFRRFLDKPAYLNYMYGQIKELIEAYNPSVLWFDGNWVGACSLDECPGTWTDDDGKNLYDYVRSLKPDIIVNSRLAGPNNSAGDYTEMDDRQIPSTMPTTYWETPMTINNNWGYNAFDDNWKSPQTLIEYITAVESRQGNLLLNIGPMADGTIPAPSVERLLTVGTWLTGAGLAESAPTVAGSRGNFEVVAREGNRLCHYWRNNDVASDHPWSGPTACFAENVSSAPALIRSSLGDRRNDLEVVVQEGTRLCHYWRDTNGNDNPWSPKPTACFGQNVTSAPALIQSSFGARGGNFELVVQEGSRLCHYWRDNNGADNPWSPEPTACFGQNVTSAPALIQSNLGPGKNHFEVVVRQNGRVCHYTRQNNGSDNPWSPEPTACFGQNVTSAPAMAQMGDGSLVVVVREGTRLCQYDRLAADAPWSAEPVACFGNNVTSAPALIHSSFGGVDNSDLEVVAHEGGQLCHYSRKYGNWSTACSPIGKDSILVNEQQ